jgi:geranylgeranyl diphosphate synthase, type I
VQVEAVRQRVRRPVADLGFAQRWDIGVDDYLRMIDGKTAAIVAFAAWSGARIAGRDDVVCEDFREFGRLLGLGFQIRDDFLGIWGDASATGKQPGDDIRGRKQSIPIIMLLGLLSERQARDLRDLYHQEDVLADDVERVTALLDEFGVAERVQQLTMSYHDQALDLLGKFAGPSPERDILEDLAERLVDRSR